MKTKIFEFFSRIPLWLWCALVFCIAIGARFYWIEQKAQFHCAESMSVVLCSYAPALSFSNSNENSSKEILSGREVKNRFYSNEIGIKDFAEDIFHLRQDNRDYCHTNFYYSCLRAALYGNDTTNMPSVIKRGFFLNIVFFSIGFVFLGLLARELFREKLQIVTGLALGTLCAGMLSMSVWLRPYDLWFATTAIFSYAFVLSSKQYFTGTGTLVSFKNFWILTVVTAGTLLSVYFSIVFVVLLGVALCGLAIKKNGAKFELPFFASVFMSALILATAIYPNYPLGFLVDRGTEAAQKFSPAQIFENLQLSFSGALKIFENSAFGVPVVLLLLAGGISLFILKKKHTCTGVPAEQESVVAITFARASLLTAAVLSFLAIIYLAPFKTVRYVAALLPILLFAVPCVFSFARQRWLGILGNILAITLFAFGAFSAKPEPMERESKPTLTQRVKHLVYRENPDAAFPCERLSEKTKNYFLLNNWRLHGLDLMKIPDDAQCHVVNRSETMPETYDVPATLAAGEKALVIIPIWGRPDKLDIHEIHLSHGKISAEIPMDCGGVFYEFESDPAAPATTLRLNVERAENRGIFYDTIPEAPADF